MNHGKGLAFTEGQSGDPLIVHFYKTQKGKAFPEGIQTQRGKKRKHLHAQIKPNNAVK